MTFKLIFTLTVAGLALLFIIQNVASVEIQFMFWSIQLSRSLLMFLMLSAGIIIGWFFHSYINHQAHRKHQD